MTCHPKLKRMFYWKKTIEETYNITISIYDTNNIKFMYMELFNCNEEYSANFYQIYNRIKPFQYTIRYSDNTLYNSNSKSSLNTDGTFDSRIEALTNIADYHISKKSY